MNYRKKYIRAMCFMLAFAVIALSAYCTSTSREYRVDCITEAETMRGIYGFQAEINSISAAPASVDKQMHAALAKEYLSMSGAESRKVGKLNEALNRIKTGSAVNDDFLAIELLGKRLKLADLADGNKPNFYRIIYSCNFCSKTAKDENKSPLNTGNGDVILHAKSAARSFLCSGLKYSYSACANNCCIAYNDNQYMIICTRLDSISYFYYDCDINSDITCSENLAEAEAIKTAEKALSYKASGAGLPKICFRDFSNNIYRFRLRYPSETDFEVKVSVRADTCKVILFDAREMCEKCD